MENNKVAAAQSCSCVTLFATPWTTEHLSSLSFTISQSLLKPMSSQSMMPSNHHILCHPLLVLLQSSPASGSFPKSQHLPSGSQITGDSASALVLAINIQGWFPLELTGLIALQSKEISGVFSSTTLQKHQFFEAKIFFFLFMMQISYLYMTVGKFIALTIYTSAKWCLWFLIGCLSLSLFFFKGASVF